MRHVLWWRLGAPRDPLGVSSSNQRWFSCLWRYPPPGCSSRTLVPYFLSSQLFSKPASLAFCVCRPSSWSNNTRLRFCCPPPACMCTSAACEAQTGNEVKASQGTGVTKCSGQHRPDIWKMFQAQHRHSHGLLQHLLTRNIVCNEADKCISVEMLKEELNLFRQFKNH